VLTICSAPLTFRRLTGEDFPHIRHRWSHTHFRTEEATTGTVFAQVGLMSYVSKWSSEDGKMKNTEYEQTRKARQVTINVSEKAVKKLQEPKGKNEGSLFRVFIRGMG
jgi:hypothetical protein